MSILLSNEITEAVKKELNSACDSVQIITAYCKESAIRKLDSYIGSGVQKRKIMIRYRMDDLLRGSSDISAASYCLQNGWNVYARFDLHAKTYIVDNKRGIVASANATNSGLGIGKQANMEMGTLVDIEQADVDKIKGLYTDAIELSESLVSRMKDQLDQIKLEHSEGKYHEWSRDITELFHPEIKTLFSYEIPGEEISDGYVDFLDQDFCGNIDALKNAFRWSNAYLWLLSTLKVNNNCMYFGALTAQMHNALVADPKPYRKDVKIHLANLLNWVEKLRMQEVLIDRPNYSQRIRLVR